MAVPLVLPGPGEPRPAAPARREYAPRQVKIRMEDLWKWRRTPGSLRCTERPNGEPAKGIPHTRACRDRLEQATKDVYDERFFAAEARLNRRLGPGDEPSEAERPAREEYGSRPSAPAVPEALAMDLAAITADGPCDDDNRADRYRSRHRRRKTGSGRLQPSTVSSLQVKSWQLGNAAVGLASCPQC